MKKTISICFFTIVLFLLLYILGLYILWGRSGDGAKEEVQAEEETQESLEFAESMSVKKPYSYRILEKDGKLAVYGADGEELLFETNIRMEELDRQIQKRVREGITFSTESELYDFLESYSS